MSLYKATVIGNFLQQFFAANLYCVLRRRPHLSHGNLSHGIPLMFEIETFFFNQRLLSLENDLLCLHPLPQSVNYIQSREKHRCFVEITRLKELID